MQVGVLSFPTKNIQALLESLWERPCVAIGRTAAAKPASPIFQTNRGAWITAASRPIATQGRSYRAAATGQDHEMCVIYA